MKYFLSLILALNLYAYEVNSQIGVVSNYVLFGDEKSKKVSFQSFSNIELDDFYATVHTNSMMIDDVYVIQTWWKLGYNYKFSNGYIKTNYVKDYYFNAQKNNGDYVEVMPGYIFKWFNLNFYNNYNLSTSEFFIYQVEINRTFNGINVSLDTGRVIRSNNYYELTISRDIFYCKIVHTDIENKDYFLLGLNHRF